jgi:hypothetical protein
MFALLSEMIEATILQAYLYLIMPYLEPYLCWQQHRRQDLISADLILHLRNGC